MATSTWILLCDESGAKGFTDQPADKDAPIGVVAGALIAQEKYEEFSAAIQKIIEPHKKPDAKFHITDLAHPTQEDIRNNIYQLIEEMGCTIIYEAIPHDLAHKAYLDEKKNLNTLNNAARKKGFRYNLGDPKKRLLTLLFAGCLNRAHHHLTQELNVKEEIELITLTDNMDKPVLEEIKNTVADIFFFTPEIKEEISPTRYNINTNSVEKNQEHLNMN